MNLDSLSAAMHEQHVALARMEHPQARLLASYFLDLEMRARDQEAELDEMKKDRLFREWIPMREFVEELWWQYTKAHSTEGGHPIQYDELWRGIEELQEASETIKIEALK